MKSTSVRLIVILALSCCMFSLAFPQVGSPTVVGYWHLEETSGAVLYDASGYGNDASAGLTATVPGVIGNGRQFPPTTDPPYNGIIIPASPSLDVFGTGGNGITLEAFLKISDYEGSGVNIIAKDYEYWLGLGSYGNTGYPQLGIFVNGTAYYIQGDSLVPKNTWFHVAGVYDGSALSLYINYSLVKTIPLSGPVLGNSNPIRCANHGEVQPSTENFIDEIRITRGGLVPAQFVHQAGIVAGTVTAANSSLAGVPVKLLDPIGLPVAGIEAQVTNGSGHYQFNNVPVGTFQVMIVEPLGYAADLNPKSVEILANTTTTVDFALSYSVLCDRAEKWSYWKNAVDKVLAQKKSEETAATLSSYIGVIQQHYTPHFNFFANSDLGFWQDVLSKPCHPTKRDLALAELAALVLNFGSLRVGQYTVITEDGRTAGDVLSYVSSLVANPQATDSDLEDAKKIAAKANHGSNQKIKAGEVPASSILYKTGGAESGWGEDMPVRAALHQNFPNPFNPSTIIGYQLPIAGNVKLTVYDLLGREVATLVDGMMSAGVHEAMWNAVGMSSGVYVSRLQVASGQVFTKRMLLLK